MEKIVNIDGKDVKFKSTAGTPIRYQMQFKSDMLEDLTKLKTKLDNVNNGISEFKMEDLETFEKIAWAMAKTSDKSIPPMEDWLDEFDMFSIYQILPELSELMIANFKAIDGQKKNIIPQENQKEIN